jgi:hypothetical protein
MGTRIETNGLYREGYRPQANGGRRDAPRDPRLWAREEKFSHPVFPSPGEAGYRHEIGKKSGGGLELPVLRYFAESVQSPSTALVARFLG